jgi:hypothetical protein
VHLNLVVLLWWQALQEKSVTLAVSWHLTGIQALTSRSNSRALMRCRLMVARISQTSLMQMHSFPRSMMLQPDM